MSSECENFFTCDNSEMSLEELLKRLVTQDDDGCLRLKVKAVGAAPAAAEASLQVLFNNGGLPVLAGLVVILQAPFDGTITQSTIIADADSTASVDIWKCSFAQYDAYATHPAASDSIVAAAPPALTTANKSTDSTLTGWTVSIVKGDVLFFLLMANDNATNILVNLNVTKS